jgi:hypothetical protein
MQRQECQCVSTRNNKSDNNSGWVGPACQSRGRGFKSRRARQQFTYAPSWHLDENAGVGDDLSPKLPAFSRRSLRAVG